MDEKKRQVWRFVIQTAISILTAIATALGVTSCMAAYAAANPKFTAKHWEKSFRRSDWGSIIVDAMKFCLQAKYEQCASFVMRLQRRLNAS